MKIIDDEEYEKNKTFTIVLEEPILLEVGQRHGELRTVVFQFKIIKVRIQPWAKSSTLSFQSMSGDRLNYS